MKRHFTNLKQLFLVQARKASSIILSGFNSTKQYCIKYYLSIGWWSFAAFLISYFAICVVYANALWVANFIMSGGIFLTIMFSLFMALYGNKQSQIATEKKLKHQQNLFLEAMRVDREESAKQIKTILQLIQTVDSSTKEQIKNYTEQTEKVVSNLKDVVMNIGDNSTLLAEILKKEMEKDIQNVDRNLQNAESNLHSSKSFKFGRDFFGFAGDSERSRDITDANKKVSTWKRHKNYLVDQLNKLADAFLN